MDELSKEDFELLYACKSVQGELGAPYPMAKEHFPRYQTLVLKGYIVLGEPPASSRHEHMMASP
ncbi:MAG: hypothetical protein ACRCUC_14605 [Aestuariivirga sp.]